jgi:hypothetical protein
MSARWCLALAGCVEVPSSGNLLEPVPDAAPAEVVPVAAPPAEPTEPQGDFDFEGEDRPEDEVAEPAGADPLDPNELQARATAIVPGPSEPQLWDPNVPLPDTSFGVRLMAVLLDVQPPRAVLGMPDGREIVVQPGALLPEQGVVVLAIGRDAVQIAHVTPQGFYAKVETETLRALYPSSTTTP